MIRRRQDTSDFPPGIDACWRHFVGARLGRGSFGLLAYGFPVCLRDARLRQDYIWNVIWDAVIAHGNDKAFDGEILLFRAIRASGFVDVATGWDRVGALRIFDVPGYHEFVFSVTRSLKRSSKVSWKTRNGEFRRAGWNLKAMPNCGQTGDTIIPAAADDRSVRVIRPTQSLVQILSAGLTELSTTRACFLK